MKLCSDEKGRSGVLEEDVEILPCSLPETVMARLKRLLAGKLADGKTARQREVKSRCELNKTLKYLGSRCTVQQSLLYVLFMGLNYIMGRHVLIIKLE